VSVHVKLMKFGNNSCCVNDDLQYSCVCFFLDIGVMLCFAVCPFCAYNFILYFCFHESCILIHISGLMLGDPHLECDL